MISSLHLTATGIGCAVVPICIGAHAGLCAILRRRKPPIALSGQYFLLIATYGALLVVLLAAACHTWSDAVTLAAMYLLLAAPFVLLIIAAHLRRMRQKSVFHKFAFYAAVLYPALWLPIVSVYFLAAVQSISGE